MPNPRTASRVTTRWHSARIPDPDLHRLLRLLFGNDPSGAVAEGMEANRRPRAVSGGRGVSEWSPRLVPAETNGAGGVVGGSSSRPHRGGVA